MVTHSCILAWKISWTEEPGGLLSMRSQRVGHDWATNTYLLTVKSGFLLLSQSFLLQTLLKSCKWAWRMITRQCWSSGAHSLPLDSGASGRWVSRQNCIRMSWRVAVFRAGVWERRQLCGGVSVVPPIPLTSSQHATPAFLSSPPHFPPSYSPLQFFPALGFSGRHTWAKIQTNMTGTNMSTGLWCWVQLLTMVWC